VCGSPGGHAGQILGGAMRDVHTACSVGNDAFPWGWGRGTCTLAFHGPCPAADGFRPSFASPTWLSDRTLATYIRPQPRRRPDRFDPSAWLSDARRRPDRFDPSAWLSDARR
jgi:hypothetical protein